MMVIKLKKGFAAIYMVYSFFLVFIIMLLSVFMINNYKSRFLNTLKEDIKEEIKNYHIEKLPENDANLENLS